MSTIVGERWQCLGSGPASVFQQVATHWRAGLAEATDWFRTQLPALTPQEIP
jgi:hypothetical protein